MLDAPRGVVLSLEGIIKRDYYRVLAPDDLPAVHAEVAAQRRAWLDAHNETGYICLSDQWFQGALLFSLWFLGIREFVVFDEEDDIEAWASEWADPLARVIVLPSEDVPDYVVEALEILEQNGFHDT